MGRYAKSALHMGRGLGRGLSLAWARSLLICCGALVALVLAGPAAACSIDGIASMSINGYLAGLNHTPSTPGTMSYWAMFTLGTTAPEQQVQLGENLAKLKPSLPAEAFTHPFEWSFGDGASARGVQVAHRYAHPGWYRVSVRYDWASQHRWVVFDSAELQVHSPQLFQEAGTGLPVRTLWMAGIGMAVSVISLAVVARQLLLCRRAPFVGDEVDDEAAGETMSHGEGSPPE